MRPWHSGLRRSSLRGSDSRGSRSYGSDAYGSDSHGSDSHGVVLPSRRRHGSRVRLSIWGFLMSLVSRPASLLVMLLLLGFGGFTAQALTHQHPSAPPSTSIDLDGSDPGPRISATDCLLCELTGHGACEPISACEGATLERVAVQLETAPHPPLSVVRSLPLGSRAPPLSLHSIDLV